MRILARPIERLIDEFSRLPGIGPKTASRLVFYLIRAPEEQASSLAQALQALHQQTRFCEICHNITEQSPCPICSDEGRDRGLICVVEEPLDVVAIERTREFKGTYHVLHGAISPSDGIGPDDLRIAQLLERLKKTSVRELLLATNPNLEGEATSMYIARLVGSQVGRITRLARGLPVGADLEYADEVTLGRALTGRRDLC